MAGGAVTEDVAVGRGAGSGAGPVSPASQAFDAHEPMPLPLRAFARREVRAVLASLPARRNASSSTATMESLGQMSCRNAISPLDCHLSTNIKQVRAVLASPALNARQARTAPVGSACRSASPGSPAIATAAGGTPRTKFACIALRKGISYPSSPNFSKQGRTRHRGCRPLRAGLRWALMGSSGHRSKD